LYLWIKQTFKPLKLSSMPRNMYNAVPLETMVVFLLFGIAQVLFPTFSRPKIQ
jgi:hypothetical protein